MDINDQRYKIAENVFQLPVEKVEMSKLISYKIKTQSNTIDVHILILYLWQ